jgi:hypothetical protein
LQRMAGKHDRLYSSRFLAAINRHILWIGMGFAYRPLPTVERGAGRHELAILACQRKYTAKGASQIEV